MRSTPPFLLEKFQAWLLSIPAEWNKCIELRRVEQVTTVMVAIARIAATRHFCCEVSLLVAPGPKTSRVHCSKGVGHIISLVSPEVSLHVMDLYSHLVHASLGPHQSIPKSELTVQPFLHSVYTGVPITQTTLLATQVATDRI